MGINFFCTFEHPETREFGYLLERVSLRPLFLNSRCIGYLFFFLLMKYVLRHSHEKKSIRRLLWGWGHTSSFNWFLFFCVSSTKLISMRGDLSFLMFCFSFSSHLKPSTLPPLSIWFASPSLSQSQQSHDLSEASLQQQWHKGRLRNKRCVGTGNAHEKAMHMAQVECTEDNEAWGSSMHILCKIENWYWHMGLIIQLFCDFVC